MNCLPKKATLAALAFVATFAAASQVFAADSLSLPFMTHAAFFSKEMKLPKRIDPQAFVADAATPEAVGPQGIAHVAGFRPANIDDDAKTATLYTAEGKPLGFDLGAWLGASGTVDIATKDGVTTLSAKFAGLEPSGVYSLFENHFDQKPVGFTPLDGDTKANTFTAGADGSASVTMRLSHMPTHDNAVLLVYHSDGQSHGMQRGAIGDVAHHQLIARPE